MAALISECVMIGTFETIPWTDDIAGETAPHESVQVGAAVRGATITQLPGKP